MKYSCALFDLDGTLINSSESIRKSFEFALKKMNVSQWKITDVNHLIGPPILDSFQRFYGFSLEKAREGYAAYLEEYVDNGQMYTAEIFPEVARTLEKLIDFGCMVGVATTKNQVNARKIIHQVLPNYFKDSDIYGAMNDGSRSQKKEIISDFIKDHRIINLSEVVMVGDRYYDIEGAKEVGIDSVGVTYGCGSIEELKKSEGTYLISSFGELEKIIEK
ncbi:MAG: HAD hydrolase-like protein [Eubacteriaceae bacterium]